MRDSRGVIFSYFAQVKTGITDKLSQVIVSLLDGLALTNEMAV